MSELIFVSAENNLFMDMPDEKVLKHLKDNNLSLSDFFECKEWDIAEKIWRDLRGRRGFDIDIDDDVENEILMKMAIIIQEGMK